jgi:hypothetical protein
MKQHEVVIEVMKANGGYATLGYLYQEVPKVQGVKWNTKTPFASIRRIVQDERFFFKIRPGLWALKGYKDKLPFSNQIAAKTPAEKKIEFSHSYYQGLMVEIGRLKRYDTFVPNQDKQKQFLGKPLSEMTTMPEIPLFTYNRLIQRAQTIDIVWFNERHMPSAFAEVEHSTDMYNSLLKYVDLQDFNAEFWIVAPLSRRKEFVSKLGINAFVPIKERVKFLSYDQASEWHTSLSKLIAIESGL